MGEEPGPNFLPRAARRKLEPEEPIAGTGTTVLDYWRWAHSDLLENIQRGILAEFILAAALGITHQPRIGWAGFDLDYDGFKIEVKSSAYLQAWNQRRLTKPVFGIGPRQQLDKYEIAYESDPRYVADCYVFCLFAATDGASANVLNLDEWIFFVVPTFTLTAACGAAKTITETKLRTITTPVRFAELKEWVDAIRSDASYPAAAVNRPDVALKSGDNRFPYLVAERGTRANPVIVEAMDYSEAQMLARADPSIAALGNNISAFRLTEKQLKQELLAGSVDLRSRPK